MELTKRDISGTRILCVDDNPECLALLRVILIRKGADVTLCSSAEEAISFLKKKRYDVVISDLSMPPGLDGYDLAHALRKMEDQDQTRAATPTIALSGDALVPSKKRRFADFQVYMKKPMDKARLIYIIERLAEADGDSVKLGSLGRWETKEANFAKDAAAIAAAAAADDEATTAMDEAILAPVRLT